MCLFTEWSDASKWVDHGCSGHVGPSIGRGCSPYGRVQPMMSWYTEAQMVVESRWWVVGIRRDSTTSPKHSLLPARTFKQTLDIAIAAFVLSSPSSPLSELSECRFNFTKQDWWSIVAQASGRRAVVRYQTVDQSIGVGLTPRWNIWLNWVEDYSWATGQIFIDLALIYSRHVSNSISRGNCHCSLIFFVLWGSFSQCWLPNSKSQPNK